jgi:ketosteroid isomerase-like protein
MSESSSTRRRYLRAVGALGVVGVAGCSEAIDGDNDSGTPVETTVGSGTRPERVVRNFYAHLDEGDLSAANELLHEEGAISEISQTTVAPFEASDVTVPKTSPQTRTDERAEISTTVSLSHPDLDEAQLIGSTISLRVTDDFEEDWRLHSDIPLDVRGDFWETPTPTPDSGPQLPADAREVIDRYHEALDDGDRQAAERLRHSNAQLPPLTEDKLDRTRRDDVDFVDIRPTSVGSSTIEVRGTYVDGSGDGQSQILELRTEAGEWRLYKRLGYGRP